MRKIQVHKKADLYRHDYIVDWFVCLSLAETMASLALYSDLILLFNPISSSCVRHELAALAAYPISEERSARYASGPRVCRLKMLLFPNLTAFHPSNSWEEWTNLGGDFPGHVIPIILQSQFKEMPPAPRQQSASSLLSIHSALPLWTRTRIMSCYAWQCPHPDAK